MLVLEEQRERKRKVERRKKIAFDLCVYLN